MSYYGVILNVGNLGDNFYLNLFLITVVEYPAKFLTIALLDKLGRKRMYIGYMLLGGIACLGTIYPVVQNDECKYSLVMRINPCTKEILMSCTNIIFKHLFSQRFRKCIFL